MTLSLSFARVYVVRCPFHETYVMYSIQGCGCVYAHAYTRGITDLKYKNITFFEGSSSK